MAVTQRMNAPTTLTHTARPIVLPIDFMTAQNNWLKPGLQTDKGRTRRRPLTDSQRGVRYLRTAISTRLGFALLFASKDSRAAFFSIPSVNSCLPVSTGNQICDRKY